MSRKNSYMRKISQKHTIVYSEKLYRMCPFLRLGTPHQILKNDGIL